MSIGSVIDLVEVGVQLVGEEQANVKGGAVLPEVCKAQAAIFAVTRLLLYFGERRSG